MQSLEKPLTAIVLGASGAIGAAIADRLEGQGARVHRLSRSATGLDVTREETVAAAAATLSAEAPRLVFNATGALEIAGWGPEKALKHIDPAAMAAQFALNATGVALLLKHFVPLMPRRGKTVFASLSARVGSIGDNRKGGWYAYRAAKAAQNQILRAASIEIARSRRDAVVLALHPGTVVTPLTEGRRGDLPAVAPAEAAANLLAVCDALGPDASGSFYAYDGQPIPW